MRNFRVAVLASTNGTDLQAIVDEIQAGLMEGVSLEVVMSDQEGCGALERARRQGYETVFIDPWGKTREEFDEEMAKSLERYEVDLVVLVGYMRILTPVFLRRFTGKVINVHPSLIPKYCGKSFYGEKVHRAVLEAGDKVSGMTIHYVDEGVDTGKIIMQQECPVLEEDTIDTLKVRVQELEKKWYPEVIRRLAKA